LSARQLLELIHERGGVATVKQGGAAPQIQITPRGLVSDLASDIQKFKPALLELLAPEPPATDAATPSPFRTVAPFLLVPRDFTPALGAAKIAATLHFYERLFAAARRGDLPTDALEMEIAVETVTVENLADVCIELEKVWSDRARRCQKEKRDLTTPEQSALDAAAELLETVWACFDGPGAAAWLDLGALDSQLDADLAAMHKKQRAAKVAAQSEATP
jgi:hypothetical protein